MGIQVHNKYLGTEAVGANTKVEIWFEKLQLLDKLTPREDLDGYEYRENFYEQQHRLQLQTDFQRRLKQEVRRRAEQPTPVEQVEDALHDMLQAVCSEHERQQQRQHDAEVLRERMQWHPSAAATAAAQRPAVGLRALGTIVREDGSVARLVSDFDFVDLVVGPTGLMLASSAPPHLRQLHDIERCEWQEALLDRLEAQQSARARPLSQKIRSAVQSARQVEQLPPGRSPSVMAVQRAAAEAADHLLIHPVSSSLSTGLGASRRLLQGSGAALLRGLRGLLQVGQEPVSSLEDLGEAVVEGVGGSMKRLVEKTKFVASAVSVSQKQLRGGGREAAVGTKEVQSAEDAALEAEAAPTVEEVRRKVLAQEEAARAEEEARLLALEQSKSEKQRVTERREQLQQLAETLAQLPRERVRLPDAVQVTLTLQLSPPPLYVMRPRHTPQREAEHLRRRTSETMKRYKQRVRRRLRPLQPYVDKASKVTAAAARSAARSAAVVAAHTAKATQAAAAATLVAVEKSRGRGGGVAGVGQDALTEAELAGVAEQEAEQDAEQEAEQEGVAEAKPEAFEQSEAAVGTGEELAEEASEAGAAADDDKDNWSDASSASSSTFSNPDAHYLWGEEDRRGRGRYRRCVEWRRSP